MWCVKARQRIMSCRLCASPPPLPLRSPVSQAHRCLMALLMPVRRTLLSTHPHRGGWVGGWWEEAAAEGRRFAFNEGKSWQTYSRRRTRKGGWSLSDVSLIQPPLPHPRGSIVIKSNKRQEGILLGRTVKEAQSQKVGSALRWDHHTQAQSEGETEAQQQDGRRNQAGACDQINSQHVSKVP